MGRARGRKYLKIAGILELLSVMVEICILMYVLSQNDVTVIASLGFPANFDSIFHLFLIYGNIAFSILAGLVALLFANSPKHSTVCMFFGILALLFAASTLTFGEFSVIKLIVTGCGLFIPCVYLYGAVLNKASR